MDAFHDVDRKLCANTENRGNEELSFLQDTIASIQNGCLTLQDKNELEDKITLTREEFHILHDLRASLDKDLEEFFMLECISERELFVIPSLDSDEGNVASLQHRGKSQSLRWP